MRPDSPAETREQSLLCPLQLEGRLESRYATPEVPRDNHHNSRGTLSFPRQFEKSLVFPTSSREEGLFPCFDSRGIQTFRRTSRGGHLTYCNRRVTLSFLPQVERTRRSTSARDQTLFLCRDLRASPSSLSKLERKLDSLCATQQVPQDTSHNSRRNPSFLPQLKMCPMFPTSSRDEGKFPCFDSRGSSTFHSHLKRTPASHIETREKPRDSCCKLK